MGLMSSPSLIHACCYAGTNDLGAANLAQPNDGEPPILAEVDNTAKR